MQICVVDYTEDNRNKAGNRILFWMIAIFVISLIARLEYRSALVIDTPIRGDAYYYLSYAHNLVEHHVFAKEPTFNSDKIPEPDSFWPPGFPFLLSSALRIGGLSGSGFYPIATLYNAVLGALIAPMIFYICLQIMPIRFSVGASLITAFSPHLISIGGYILTETLFTFLIVSSFVFTIIGSKNQSLLSGAISGLLMGLACLTNPVILFFPFIVAGFVYKKDTAQNRHRFFSISTSYLFLFIIVIGCWETRNFISVQHSSQSATNRAVINLMNGLYPDYHEAFMKGITKRPDYPMNLDIIKAEGSPAKALIIIAENIINNPVKYLSWYLIEKPLLFWSWDIHIGVGDIYVYPVIQSLFTTSIIWNGIRILFKYFNPLFIIINFVGIALFFIQLFTKSKKIDIQIWLTLILILYSTLIYTIFYPDPRYSIPFRPAFYIFFVWILYQIKEQSGMKRGDVSGRT